MSEFPFTLLYDGGEIDVLWDGYEQAAGWYSKFMGWKVQQQENWKPDPRAVQGRMTHMGWGLWLESAITGERLPYHFAERGTVDPNVRWCWKVRDLLEKHAFLVANGVRVTDIYPGPDGSDYFDFWATNEGARLTVYGDPDVEGDGFEDANLFRIGVRDLKQSVQWYERFTGMKPESGSPEDGYVRMSLGVNHHADHKASWMLEQLPEHAYAGNIHGAVRIRCWIPQREAFFAFHRFLRESGIETGDIGGFMQRGKVNFYFFDPDGNRFNVGSF